MTEIDLSVPWDQIGEEDQHLLIEQMVACFAGLPGVVGAPMITGTDFWADVARHLLELGYRPTAAAIKTYEAPTSLEKREAAGKWVYADPGLAPEDPRVRYARVYAEEQEAAALRIAEMRAAGELPPEGASPEQAQAWRDRRAAKREASAYRGEVRRRKVDGSFVDSPLAGIGKPKKRKGRR